MKRLITILPLLLLTICVYANDACFQFGIQDSLQTESINIKDKGIYGAVAQTFGAYLSMGFCDEDENIGYGFANTFSVGRVLKDTYINNRLLLGVSLMPYSEGLAYNFIPGIIFQPEWETSDVAKTFQFLMGAGFDSQLFSKTGISGLGFTCSISLSAYPIAISTVTQNNKTSFVGIIEYSRFCIGFSFGVGLSTGHTKD